MVTLLSFLLIRTSSLNVNGHLLLALWSLGYLLLPGLSSVWWSNSRLGPNAFASQERALHSLFIEHVLPGLYVYCVLWAAQIWFQPPWEPALPPTPSLCSWCVSQGCGDIQGWSEESIFHLFDQLERAEMLAACFFRLHQQNSMLNWLCQCCLGHRRLFCIFSVPSRTSSGEVHDSYLGNRWLGEGLLATTGKLVSLLPAPLLHPMPSYFLGSWFLVFGGYG